MNPRGVIAWWAGNPVAANLLMLFALVGGVFGVTRVKQEVFPEFDMDLVIVSVAYPGASPEEVEQGIVLAVEEQVRGLEGVKRVSSTANEGVGTVQAELLLGADAEKVLADTKNVVDAIRTFPEEAERPRIRTVTRRRDVVALIIAGPEDPSVLHRLGERARHGILASPDVTQVELEGVRPVEIAVEIPRETLRSHGLTLDMVSAGIRAASIELPGGGIKATSGEVLLRVSDRRRTGLEMADVIVAASPDGAAVRLGDIATIIDGYAETDTAYSFEGRPAVQVIAYRVGDETPTKVADAVKAYAEDLRQDLPDDVDVVVWDDSSERLKARVNLLMRNAALGLILVWVILALFLELRLAFWVSLGIPISYMGTLLIMPATGASINMITLFAFIVVLGMVVDDAIVVGENVFEKKAQGMKGVQAAIAGARQMAMPVSFAIITSMVAFAPLFFVPGVMGKIFRFIPLIVCSVLFISLVESFWILPAHLAHSKGTLERGPFMWTRRVNGWVDRQLHALRERRLKPALRSLIYWRHLTVACGLSLLIVVGTAVATGIVPFDFFPDIEGDDVEVTARLPYGTPVERTTAVGDALERAARAALVEVGEADDAIGVITRLGEGRRSRSGSSSGSHLVTVEISLVPVDDRDFSTRDFAEAWRAALPDLAGVEALTFDATSGPSAGMAVDAQLSHPDTRVLAAASEEMEEALRGYATLTDVRNAWSDGKPQLDFTLTPRGRTLGLSSTDIGRQLRASFYGAEALREQRGRDELKVMVRLPRDQRRSMWHLEELMVRTPAGGEVPLSQVASWERHRAPTSIVREDGLRVVNVTARLSAAARSPREVLESLKEEVVPELRQRHPGLEVEFVGRRRERQEAMGVLLRGFALALIAIYALLAVPFRSYIQPAIIMAAIPFGLVGAVFGHVLMGHTLSLMSVFGIVALAGVVVNDSLILIDATNTARAEGMGPRDAIVWAAGRRLRPIMLTSLTTFFGLAPMILETSVQAQFLVPMALSLGFGILFATFVILLFVPVVYVLIEDLRTGGEIIAKEREERDRVAAR